MIKKAPRVGFSLNLVPRWRARVDLARVIARHLSKRFGRISVHPGYLFRASVLALMTNGEGFLLALRENRNPGNPARSWEILINPSRYPSPGKHFPNEEENKYAKDLLAVSTAVHAVHSEIAGVERLRWWFVGWEVNKPAVRTPGDLPWHLGKL